MKDDFLQELKIKRDEVALNILHFASLVNEIGNVDIQNAKNHLGKSRSFLHLH